MILNPFSTPLNSGNGPEFVKSGYMSSYTNVNLQLETTPIIINAFAYIISSTIYPATSGAVYCRPNDDYSYCIAFTNLDKLDAMLTISFYSNGRLILNSRYDLYYTIYYAF